MTSERFIDTLLEKYRRTPDFPMLNWANDPVSFYALVNLWDDIFRTAAGRASAVYLAYGDIKMDEDSRVYDVEHPDGSKRVAVFAESKGGTFHILTRSGGGYELGFATDLDRARLISAFEIIHIFVRADLTEDGSGEALEKTLVEKYHHYFGFEDFDPFEGRLGNSTPNDDEKY